MRLIPLLSYPVLKYMIMEKRLQKILAEMGIASRRHSEEIIEEGRVTVNGQVATLGSKADIERDHIKLDGKILNKTEPKVYFAFHKPPGVVTSISDPEGRPTVKDYLDRIKFRVYPVGRLDFDSEGLLLVTNDGDFAHAVLHPTRKLPKIYMVKVKGEMDDETALKLSRGIKLDDGMTAPAKVRKLKQLKENSWVEVTLHEGKKRQIRRMMNKVGHQVIRLKRIAVGPVILGELPLGGLRPLSVEEIQAVYRLTGKKEA